MPRFTSRSLDFVHSIAALRADRPDWVYVVVYKKPRRSETIKILTSSQNVSEASRQAASVLRGLADADGWQEYGHSKTKLRYPSGEYWKTSENYLRDGYVNVYETWVQG